MKGKLIILEGIDGSGTTTQSFLLYNILNKKYKVKLTKEPYNKKIINFIKRANDPLVDLYFFLLDRYFHYNLIEKWLKEFNFVICDRSFPSTLAYQWYSTYLKNIIPENIILFLNKISRKNINPNYVFILDIDPKIALNRLAYKKNKSDIKKFEKIVFLKKVRKGYIYFAKKFKWYIIDANQQINLVNQNIINKIKL